MGKCRHNRNYLLTEEWVAHSVHVYCNGKFDKPYYGNQDVDDLSGWVIFQCEDCPLIRRFNTNRLYRLPKWFQKVYKAWNDYVMNKEEDEV